MSLDKPTRHNRIREALDRIYDQHPPQVREYLRRFQEDPKSRVFAPLAEAYRRLGRIDEAIGLCLEGLTHHSDFHGGRVALAKCYIDKGQFDKAAKELEKVVQNVPENLLAQRLLGDSLMALGQAHQALHCYKMASILAPNDIQLEEKLRVIESAIANSPPSTAELSQTVIIDTAVAKAPAPLPASETTPPLWEMESSFAPLASASVLPRSQTAAVESSEPAPLRSGVSWLNHENGENGQNNENDEWDRDDFVDKAPDSKPIEEQLSPGGIDLEESFQVQNISDLFRDNSTSPEITTPTLADLYFSQGQYEKSLLIYEKLLEKCPGDAALSTKITKCRSQLGVESENDRVDRKIDLLKDLLKRVKTDGPAV